MDKVLAVRFLTRIAAEGMELKLTKSPGIRVLLVFVLALGWGVACGYLHAPYPLAVIGALGAAAACLWLVRDVLMRPSPNRKRPNLYWLLMAAYGFVAMVALGLVSLADFAGVWLHRH